MDDDAPLPWAPRAWERAGRAPDIGAVASVACTARAVYALASSSDDGDADARLVRVDLEGGVVALGAAGLPRLAGGRLRIAPGGLDRLDELWVDAREGVFRSSDAGATFEPMEALQTNAEPDAGQPTSRSRRT